MDETDDPCEPSPRIHAFDSNGIRVSCLPAVNAPFERLCQCGHWMIAASTVEILAALDDHLEYARVYGQHG